MRIDQELGRYFLKDSIRQDVDFAMTAQSRRRPPPPAETPTSPDAQRISLPTPEQWTGIPTLPLTDAIAHRESRRRFSPSALTLEEVSFLLWASQGVRRAVNPAVTLRTVPSAGARHAIDTHLAVLRVSGLESGMYRYLPIEHQLAREFDVPELPDALRLATLGQRFVGDAAVVFFWTAVPARMEWRYAEASYKVLAIDAGHVAQNLYLACECIDAGTCAIGAYDQEACDRLLRVDGDEEFTLYIAPVGKC